MTKTDLLSSFSDTLNKYIEEEEPEMTQARKQTEAKKD